MVIEHLVFKKLRFRYHDIERSKRKYLAVERDMQKDVSWPTLTSEMKSSPSLQSITPSPACRAEIVIENENKFAKDHVLTGMLPLDVSELATVSCDRLDDPTGRLNLRLSESAPSVMHQHLEMDNMHTHTDWHTSPILADPYFINIYFMNIVVIYFYLLSIKCSTYLPVLMWHSICCLVTIKGYEMKRCFPVLLRIELLVSW